MADIITLTINPAIDASTSVEQLAPFHKMRCSPARRDPGGGGINVARVAKRFGADVCAIYTMGGTLGQLLRRLLEQEQVTGFPVPISEETREDFTVLETVSGRPYRFVLPGPRLSDQEWRACLDTFVSHASHTRPPRFVVASGSLPPGVPADFYARIARTAKQAGARFVLDSSGPALKAALDAGVYMVKPSLREFRELTAARLESEHEQVTACRRLIERGSAAMVALTLGDQGALLVTKDQILRGQAAPIAPVSVVGAGDSFLGAMISSLASGHPVEDAFRYGLAAGSAALLMPGTELCRREDTERLVAEVKVHVIQDVRTDVSERSNNAAAPTKVESRRTIT
jgi:6-phosphofructokinase 2